LSERRDSLCSKLFSQLVSQSLILHCLLPAQRDDSLTGRLRSRNKISNSTCSDEPFQKVIYTIRYSQLSITFAVFDMFVCISFRCLRVHVDLIQPLAARNNKRCSVTYLLDNGHVQSLHPPDATNSTQQGRQTAAMLAVATITEATSYEKHNILVLNAFIDTRYTDARNFVRLKFPYVVRFARHATVIITHSRPTQLGYLAWLSQTCLTTLLHSMRQNGSANKTGLGCSCQLFSYRTQSFPCAVVIRDIHVPSTVRQNGPCFDSWIAVGTLPISISRQVTQISYRFGYLF